MASVRAPREENKPLVSLTRRLQTMWMGYWSGQVDSRDINSKVPKRGCGSYVNASREHPCQRRRLSGLMGGRKAYGAAVRGKSSRTMRTRRCNPVVNWVCPEPRVSRFETARTLKSTRCQSTQARKTCVPKPLAGERGVRDGNAGSRYHELT